MNPTFHLYGMKITLAGDLTAARDRVYLAHKLMFQTKMVNVNNLDIIQNNLRLDDGTHVYVMSQHGLDSATIYVPLKPISKKPEYIKEQIVEIIPFISVTEAHFPRGGLLVCRGGYNFSGYELLSPYGDVAAREYNYTPYEYVQPDGETLLLEWQVKEYYDPMGSVESVLIGGGSEWLPIFWDELPWMGGDGWDPVFYERYEGFSANPKPHTLLLTQVYHQGDPHNMTWSGTGFLTLAGQLIDSAYGERTFDGTYLTLSTEGFGLRAFAVDQANPAKYGVIYSKYGTYGTSDVWGTMWDLRPPPSTGPNTWCFKGLGHNVIFDYVGVTEWNARVKLYKINDKYVCIFVMATDEVKLLGSAIEGGDFTTVDVTDGVEYQGEVRNLFASDSYATSIGLIKRVEPLKPKTIKRE